MSTKIARTNRKHEPYERIVNDDPRTFTEAEFGVGDVSHQGDLIFVRIAALPNSAKSRLNRQLTEGNTQGSRHILAPGGEVYECKADEVIEAIAAACKNTQVDARYIGPVFDTPATVTHPEHGWQTFDFTGVMACVFQRNLDAEQREVRVRD